jgi:hypothetical protein
MEHRVSDYIGPMPLLWLSVPTQTDGTSPRGYIERNSIALISNPTGPLDPREPGLAGTARDQFDGSCLRSLERQPRR